MILYLTPLIYKMHMPVMQENNRWDKKLGVWLSLNYLHGQLNHHTPTDFDRRIWKENKTRYKVQKSLLLRKYMQLLFSFQANHFLSQNPQDSPSIRQRVSFLFLQFQIKCFAVWRMLYLGIINQDVLDDWLSCGLPINHPDIVHLVPPDLTVLLGGHRWAPDHFNWWWVDSFHLNFTRWPARNWRNTMG